MLSYCIIFKEFYLKISEMTDLTVKNICKFWGFFENVNWSRNFILNVELRQKINFGYLSFSY